LAECQNHKWCLFYSVPASPYSFPSAGNSNCRPSNHSISCRARVAGVGRRFDGALVEPRRRLLEGCEDRSGAGESPWPCGSVVRAPRRSAGGRLTRVFAGIFLLHYRHTCDTGGSFLTSDKPRFSETRAVILPADASTAQFEAQIGNQLFQPAVLFLKLLHLPSLICLHTNILLLPSATGTPNSACFNTATICSTEKRFFFTQNPLSDFAED
jgi:hypothetical protein